jgi:hypothetical protein
MRYTAHARRPLFALAITLVCLATTAAAAVGLGAPSPARPDPDVLSRLRVAASARSQALLVGANVTVGVVRPKTVPLSLAAFATGKRRLKIRTLRVAGPDGVTHIEIQPQAELRAPAVPIAPTPDARATMLARLADRDAKRAAALLREGYVAPRVDVPVADLALEDGSTTTVLVTAEFESDASVETATLPLTVSVAAIPVQSPWAAGDGHVHDSNWSDGWDSLATQVSDAKAAGHKWIVVTDHWKGIYAVGGRANANWQLYRDECMAKEAAYGIRVLPGTEIMSAGSGGHALAYALDGTSVPPRDEYYAPSALVNAIWAHTPGASYAVVAHPYSATLPWTGWSASGFRAIELMSQERQASVSTQNKWFALLRAGLSARIAGGPFVVGVANTDAHLPWQRPGEAGVTWIRSGLYTRTAVWNQIAAGAASASGREDLGFFSINGVQQGGVVTAYSSTTLTFSITQKPVTGRKCTEISIRNSNNAVVWSVSSPKATTYAKSLPTPSADTFYLVKMVFSKTNDTDYSHVWCNPVFLDRR